MPAAAAAWTLSGGRWEVGGGGGNEAERLLRGPQGGLVSRATAAR